MIPGYPPNTSLRTIAEGTWDIPMCSSAIGCKKGWSIYIHKHGRTDNAGTVHWDKADTRATKRGVRNLAKLIAIAYNSKWRAEPVWMRLYLVNVWATEQIKSKLHYRVRASWSAQDRARAKRLAYRKHRKIRTDHRNFYTWMDRGGV